MSQKQIFLLVQHDGGNMKYTQTHDCDKWLGMELRVNPMPEDLVDLAIDQDNRKKWKQSLCEKVYKYHVLQ